MKKYIVCTLYQAMVNKGVRNVSDLQRMTGLPRRSLDKCFHNNATQMNYNTAAKICEALNCDLSDLYKLVDEKEYEQILERSEWSQSYMSKGYVYFIKNHSDNLIKIGKTRDLKLRLSQLKYQFGDQLELVHSIQSDKAIQMEKDVHEKFADKRKHGEWFDLSEIDIRNT